MKTTAKILSVVIVDDETLARENVEALLQDDSEVRIVARCTTGPQAIEAIKVHRPDLVFLDVQMPDMTGLEVLAKLGTDQMPLVVFVTAYDQYAVRAFDLQAVDYLLKPFTRQRFAATLARAKAAARSGDRDALSHRIVELLRAIEELRPVAGEPAPAEPAAGAGRDERMLFRSDGELYVVAPEEIHWIEADSDYLKLHMQEKSRLVRMSLLKISAKLNPACFVRVHRSTIVNLRHVRKVTPALYGEYTLELRNGIKLKVSRTYVRTLKERMLVLG